MKFHEMYIHGLLSAIKLRDLYIERHDVKDKDIFIFW